MTRKKSLRSASFMYTVSRWARLLSLVMMGAAAMFGIPIDHRSPAPRRHRGESGRRGASPAPQAKAPASVLTAVAIGCRLRPSHVPGIASPPNLRHRRDPDQDRATPDALAVTARDGRFQQWQALLTNRNKRERSGEFLVQGVRPISLAVRHGWTISTLLHDASRSPSDWARGILDAAGAATRIAVAPALLQELGEKRRAAPSCWRWCGGRPIELERIAFEDRFLGVLFDRPMSPGNIGTLVRSADAFGASGVMITGHAADPYDPKAIRASTGSLFAVPLVRAPSHREVLEWIAGHAVQIVGTDEKGDLTPASTTSAGPLLILVGSEKSGLSVAWRAACDKVVRIPMAAGRPAR